MTGGPPGGGGLETGSRRRVYEQAFAGMALDAARATHPVTFPFTLGKLQLSQALAEFGALRGRGRPIAWLHLRDRGRGIAQLLAAAGTNASGAST